MKQRLLVGLSLVALATLAVPERANGQTFGRNKVQYRAFDFKIIETEHFDVYYYEEEREAALDAARMVERAYARLSRILQHEFRDRKPIILYASHADFQQTNALSGLIDEGTGGVTESLKERIIMPFTGSYAEFDHVLRHELVHAFQYDVIFRNAAIDNVNPFSNRYPLWFMEGMAEYLSIGHIDAITAAWVRDASLSGYLRTIGEMNMRDDYLSYRFGQALWAYIGSKWGDEVIGILLQRATRMGVERAFESTLGMSLAQLSDEWTSVVRATYLPQVTEYQRPTSFAKPVLHHKRLTDPSYMAPAISPDGKLLAVFSSRDGFFPDLWLADAETGQFKRRLVRSSQESNFESLRYGSSAASFSPDGRYLAFAAQTGGRDALYIYDLSRNRIWKKLEFKELNAIMTPTWSPDGRSIAFSGLDGGLSDLFITDLDGRLRRLTNDRYADLFPAWSPDGRSIAFSTDRAEGTDFATLSYAELHVAILDLETGTIDVLPQQEAGRNLNPVWAPDSRSLVWVSDRTGTKDLYLFDLESRTLSKLTNLLSGVMGPTATDLSPTLSWARETGRLAFVYFESAGQSVYTIEDPRTLPRVAVTDLPDERQAVPVLAGVGPFPDSAVSMAGRGGASRDSAAIAAADPGATTPGAATGEPGAPPTGEPGAADTTRVASGAISFYRDGNEFRPSNTIPEGVDVPKPVSVMALLDSASFSLPDTSAFGFRNYSVKFSPDIIGRPTIGAQVGGYYGNGLYGGSYIALSDMLGNHNIMLAGSINGSFSDATFFGGYNFLKTRANFGVGFTQVPLYRYGGSCYACIPPIREGWSDVVATDYFVRDLYRSLQGIISYPFSTFRRLEVGASATFLRQDEIWRGTNFTRGEALDETIRIFDAKYVEPTAALVFDNSLFGWTGPIAGRRYRIQASRTIGDFEYAEGLVDFRNYWNYKRKVVLATRLLSLTRIGGNADTFFLYWGGPYFLRGYDRDSFDPQSGECNRDFGARSYSPCPAADQLIGSSAAIFNAELRFPIITELQIGFLGNFPPVDAVIFFDGGLAWSDRVCAGAAFFSIEGCDDTPSEDVKLVWKREPGQDPFVYRAPLFSYGFGLRINIFYTVLRLDYAFPISRPDRSGRFSISFGPSF
jgi:Tol biopolymer transport system component